MCIVSMAGDDFWKRHHDFEPWIKPKPYTYDDHQLPTEIKWNEIFKSNGPTKEDFDALKKEVEALKELLIAAKKYDEVTGQKDCEMEEKIFFLKKVAEFVGVNLDEVFGSKKE